MAQDWFVSRDGEETGPFTTPQLKQMAATGKLQPDDKVRRGDMKAASKASSIKGLLTTVEPAPAKPSPPPPSTEPAPPTAQKKGVPSKKTIIIASVVGGACLLLCCGVFGIFGLFGLKMQDSTRKQLAEADTLWDKGDKTSAVSKYRAILDDHRSTFLKEEDRPRVYGRVIDFDMESGNTDSAKKLLADAIQKKVEPAVSHPDARTALATARREQQAKTDATQFTWKQPEGWWGDTLKSSDLRFRPMPSADYAELMTALSSKKPEQVAKLLQHADPHSLFTSDELKVMQTPYYGIINFSRDVVYPDDPVEAYTEVQCGEIRGADAKPEKFKTPLFLVSGKPDNSTGGVVSGTFYRSYELKEEKRTRLIKKTVALKLDFNYTGPDLKITGVKGARLSWIVIRIPAIFNDEKCYGWDAMISTINDRVAYVHFIERRENALDKMDFERTVPGTGNLAPTDSDLYRIKYDLTDPARPYTIEDGSGRKIGPTQPTNDGEGWKGGTIADFISRMNQFARQDWPKIGWLAFDPAKGSARTLARSEAEFYKRFGKPIENVVDKNKADNSAKPKDAAYRERFRLWTYRCTDGTVTLHVEPTHIQPPSGLGDPIEVLGINIGPGDCVKK